MISRNSAIVAQIRREIVEGRFPASSRLQSHRELASRFGVAGMTMQTALKQLEREGFIESRNRSGTFVVSQPPHLNQLALVFPHDPVVRYGSQHWSRFFQALTQAAVSFQQETGRRVLMFHGVTEHADSEDRQRLIQYMEAHRVAGVIFAAAPFPLVNTPILDLPGIPRVAFQADQPYPHVPAVTGEGELDKVLDHFAALGRRRVAVIDYNLGSKFDADLQAGLAARGMVSHRSWRQFVSMRTPSGARNAVELLMRDRERPDALYINDDHFVEHALGGLIDAGVRVAACGEPCRDEDMVVAGHANFPVAPAKPLPVRLIGYDVNLLFRTCVDLIDRQRAGEQVPGMTAVPMLWEEEVGAAKPPEVSVQKSVFRSRKMEMAVS